MIKGELKTEAQYRAVQMDSSSSLKEFSLDRKKYYRRYVLGEKIEDSENQAALMGRLVETLLMEPYLFDDKFFMSVCQGPPTGLMLEFVEALYRHTKEATDEFGEVSRSFEEISRDAYTDSGFKIKYEAVMTKFMGSEAEVFYQEIREVRAKGLSVVTTKDVTHAERIVEELRNNSVTAHIVNTTNSARYQVFNQFQIEGYDVLNHQFKSMMDKIVVDHETKMIIIYDLKCTWNVENFYEEYYIKRRSYIQALLYYAAIYKNTDVLGFDATDYHVEPPKFIVCDSTNYYNPLLYALDWEDLKDARNGFTHKGRQYPGVDQIIQDLKWAIENDVWNISRTNSINNGVVSIKTCKIDEHKDYNN